MLIPRQELCVIYSFPDTCCRIQVAVNLKRVPHPNLKESGILRVILGYLFQPTTVQFGMSWPKKPISPHGTHVFPDVRHRKALKTLHFQMNSSPRRAAGKKGEAPHGHGAIAALLYSNHYINKTSSLNYVLFFLCLLSCYCLCWAFCFAGNGKRLLWKVLPGWFTLAGTVAGSWNSWHSPAMRKLHLIGSHLQIKAAQWQHEKTVFKNWQDALKKK